MNMNVETRLAVLGQLYHIYEQFIGAEKVACRKGCALCCTRNVTLTTLEGYYIVKHLGPQGQAEVFQALRQQAAGPRLRPGLTINGMAACCARGGEIDDESGDPAPFMLQDLLAVGP